MRRENDNEDITLLQPEVFCRLEFSLEDCLFLNCIRQCFTNREQIVQCKLASNEPNWAEMVGHSSKNGCRMYCGTISRCKTNGKHYYPALLKPRDCCPRGSDHPDIDVFKLPLGGCGEYAAHLQTIIAAPNQTQWDKRKTETGLTKPLLILALRPS